MWTDSLTNAKRLQAYTIKDANTDPASHVRKIGQSDGQNRENWQILAISDEYIQELVT